MIRNPFKGWRSLIVWPLAGLVLFATACTAPATTNTPVPAPTNTPVATPSTSPMPPAGAPAAATEIRATLVNGKVELDKSEVPAGPIRFNVRNEGTIVHGLAVMGDEIDQRTDDLQPGDTAILDVQLTPGEYEVYCPVPGHRERGMTTTLMVK